MAAVYDHLDYLSRICQYGGALLIQQTDKILKLFGEMRSDIWFSRKEAGRLDWSIASLDFSSCQTWKLISDSDGMVSWQNGDKILTVYDEGNILKAKTTSGRKIIYNFI